MAISFRNQLKLALVPYTYFLFIRLLYHRETGRTLPPRVFKMASA